jgi:Flp pilus assembly protein TadD
MLRLGQSDEADVRLRRALDVARGQGLPALELRAALSLAGRLRDAGDRETARSLTAVRYARFSEGFDTCDLVAARRLLEEFEA